MDAIKISNKLDKHVIQSSGEVCVVCLRKLDIRKSITPHMCLNCERITKLCKQLINIFGNSNENEFTNQSLIRICSIRANGAFRIARCPICGARSQVRGYINPSVTCPICKIELTQFNGKIKAWDTLINRDLPYNTSEWRPVFERNSINDSNINDANKNISLNNLDKLRELKL